MSGNISDFLIFQRDQNGSLPPSLARQYLGITRQSLSEATKKGKFIVKRIAGTNHYGMSSLRLFKAMKDVRKRENQH